MIHRCSTALAAALLACPALGVQTDTNAQAVVRPPQVLGVGAVHRSGQTFVTWAEKAQLKGESYRIYRSLRKIHDVRAPDVTDLGQRTWEESGELFSDRVYDDRPCEVGAPDCGRPNKPLPCFRPRYVERHWIPTAPGGVREVAQGEGLLVWTPGVDEFPARSTGEYVWYAVTTVSEFGNENPLVTSENRVKVFERVDEPLPVEVPRAKLDCSDPAYCPHDGDGDPNPIPLGVHVFLQYMDLGDWNATFHAPNFTNCWWGEDPTAAHIRNNRQYAYAYTVHEPDPSLGPVFGPLTPVVIDLHQHAESALDQGWGASGSGAYAIGGAALKIVPIDVGDTWWFGFSDEHDYRRPYAACLAAQSPCKAAVSAFPPQAPYDRVPASGAVVNFTEFRVLRMVHDLVRKPLTGFTPDPDRVYVQGTSMGGAGALQLATRYPNVFAAAASAKPMTDYEDYLTGPAPKPERDIRYEVPQRFGAWPGLAVTSGLPLLPIDLRAPAGWADHLLPWNGTVVWDWMDQVEQMQNAFRRALGSAPFGVAAGFHDTTLPYVTQGEPYFAVARGFGLPWGGKISCGGHGGPSHSGMPASLRLSATNPNPGPFSDYRIRLSETVPGFADLSAAAYPTPPTTCCNGCAVPGPYYYLDDLLWSSSWYDWDRPPVDKKKRWEMSVKWTGSFSPAPTVDLYPQRTSKFQIIPGATYQWANIEIGTGVIVQRPSAPVVAPTAVELLRLEDVELTPAGNRIVLLRVP
jgi:hypothetical protein